MKLVLAIVTFFLLSTRLMAQDSLRVISEDTVVVETGDTVLLKSYASRYDPRKALLLAAVAPGSGQIYNKKYWKLPLVYGGFFGIGYAINFYQDNYKTYKRHLFRNLDAGLVNDGDLYTDDELGYTTGQYRTIVDKSRRERDFWVIMMGAMYILQIVDAHVDAHLKEFDVNPTLKVSIRPSMTSDPFMGTQNTVALVLRF